MVAVNLVLHVHFPLETTDFRLKSVGKRIPWFDPGTNNARFRDWARELYWPIARTLAALVHRHPHKLKLNLSLSGSFLEYCERQDPVLLEFWQDLTNFCELVAEPAQHGLAFMISEDELAAQVDEHRTRLIRLFNKHPRVMHNPGLIYSDFTGRVAHRLGFQGCLLEGWDPILPGDHSPSHVFHHVEQPQLKLLASNPCFTIDLQRSLLRHDRRPFSLAVDRYHSWFEKEAKRGAEVITVFLDLSQSHGRGRAIQGFLDQWLGLALQDSGCSFVTASEAIARHPSRGAVHASAPVSQNLEGHDVSAWLGNSLQQDLLERLTAFAPRVLASGDADLIRDWRHLQALDSFSHMRVTFFESEEEPASGHHRSNPYDVYLRLMNMLEDLEYRLTSGRSEPFELPAEALGRPSQPARSPNPVQ